MNSIEKIQKVFRDSSFVNALFWAKGSTYASTFLLVSNWFIVHWLVLSVWTRDDEQVTEVQKSLEQQGSIRDLSLNWTIAGYFLSKISVSAARRLLLARLIMYTFHIAEVCLMYVMYASILVDPGVVKPDPNMSATSDGSIERKKKNTEILWNIFLFF